MRLLSIDVFRGITVALMILVNCISVQTSYALLMHADWHGCTVADWVFPFFLFIVGVSIVLALSKQKNKGVGTKEILLKVLKRALVLFLIGLFLNAYPYHLNFENIRLLGVLQRIAICYFIVSCLYWTTNAKTQALVSAALLIVYGVLMNVWGGQYEDLQGYSLENNLAGVIDSWIIPANHLYSYGFDPEGLFSTLPAIATTLLGVCLGQWLLSSYSALEKLKGMIFMGVIFLALGAVWSVILPMNKSLWTSSYVLWTTGLALLTFSACYWVLDIKQWRKGGFPFEVFGVNALSAFILHVLFLKTQYVLFIKQGEQFISLRAFFLQQLSFVSLEDASLIYAILSVLFWFFVINFWNKSKITTRTVKEQMAWQLIK